MNTKKYDCSKCNYRDRTINFCGFCTKRLLDEMKEAKVKNGNYVKAFSMNVQAIVLASTLMN